MKTQMMEIKVVIPERRFSDIITTLRGLKIEPTYRSVQATGNGQKGTTHKKFDEAEMRKVLQAWLDLEPIDRTMSNLAAATGRPMGSVNNVLRGTTVMARRLKKEFKVSYQGAKR